MHFFPWNNPGFGTRYSSASLPDSAYGIAFSSDSASVAIGHALSPYVSAYPWTTGSGLGTKYSNPATLPPGAAYSVAFN